MIIVETFTDEWISTTCGVSGVQNLEVVAPVAGLPFSQQSLMAISFNYTDPDDGLVYFASGRVEGASVTTRTAMKMLEPAAVLDPPIAAFTVFGGGDYTGVPVTVFFTNTSTVDPAATVVTYAWDFGNGGSSTARNPIYSYTAPGDYMVSLTVCDRTLCDTTTQNITVRGGASFATALSGLPANLNGITQGTVTFANAISPAAATGALELADFTVSGATLANLSAGSGTGPQTYTFDVIPTGATTIEIRLLEDRVRDGNNTGNAASNTLIATFDNTPPTVSISGTHGFPGDPVAIEIVFDEPVSGFVAGDIEVAGGVVSAFVNTCGSNPCARFTATLTAEAGQEFSYSARVPASVATDAAGNPNEASAAFTPPAPDGSAPVLTITGVPDGFVGSQTVAITFDFGEDVFGFEDSDISVTGGTLGPISGGRQSWTAELTLVGTETVTISVAAGAVQDATGTPSLAASATGRIASDEVASRLIGEFMASRASALLAAQPRLSRFLTNSGDPTGSVSVTRGAGDIQLSTGMRGPIWVALDAQWGEAGEAETSYTHLTVGSHAPLGEATILGVMLQLDHATSREGVAEIEGTGWLVGPYFATALGQGPLYLDGRVLWGVTDNEISPLGTYTDSFDTERWLATLALAGRIETARATLLPQLQYAYTEDRQEAYLDGLSNPVAAQTISQGELSASLGWEVPVGDLGLTLFTGEVSGIWGVQDGGGSDFDGSRGRLDLGLSHHTATGLQMTVGGYLDGIGNAALTRHGVELSLDWRF
ncbi:MULTISPECIES: Ig-like domain-containing protein [unclassified Yoonia]|uniref:Ig-like domain-containing protein n=1 Tax=unclassified Yoonia TaxID=2629118 RepID=UPI002AFF5F9E|nr:MULTISPECIES: Ig-like domain-containing protein [unclassified Yoonia]